MRQARVGAVAGVVGGGLRGGEEKQFPRARVEARQAEGRVFRRAGEVGRFIQVRRCVGAAVLGHQLALGRHRKAVGHIVDPGEYYRKTEPGIRGACQCRDHPGIISGLPRKVVNRVDVGAVRQHVDGVETSGVRTRVAHRIVRGGGD